MRSHYILLLSLRHRLSLVVIKLHAIGVHHDLGGIVEEDARCLVREQVAQTVLGRVVHPLLYPDIWRLDFLLRLLSLAGASCCRVECIQVCYWVELLLLISVKWLSRGGIIHWLTLKDATTIRKHHLLLLA